MITLSGGKSLGRFCLGNERGTSLLEFAIVLPVLVYVFFSSFEVSRMLGQYSMFSQVAYEGARYAASLPGMEQGQFGTDEATAHAAGARRHEQVQEVMEKILESYDLGETSWYFVTSYHKTAIAHEPANRITVQVVADYSPLFRFSLPSFEIRARATSPYLYPDSVE